MSIESSGSFENKKSIKVELEEIVDLQNKRKTFQEHWSQLFSKIQDLDFKYPLNVKFDEQKKFRGDRMFYSSEDQGKYKVLNTEIEQVEVERNELDKEILQRRFEVGLKYLKDINARENTSWKLMRKHTPDPTNPMDTLSVEEWRCVMDKIDARLEVFYEAIPSFIDGVKNVAKDIGDNELIENLSKWPKKRKLPYNNISVSFSVGPETFFRSNTDLWPGLSISKRFNDYNEEYDRVDVNLPRHQAYAFPKIDENQREQAKEEMLKLGHTVGIEYL